MQGGPPPNPDRRVSSRSLITGFALYLGLFAVLVAVSYPLSTGVVLAVGLGLYVMAGVIQRSTHERSLRLSRTELRFCFRLRLE